MGFNKCYSKISKEAEVTQIKTKLSKPSSEIKAEVKRVMQLIPKMKSAATHSGKAVNIKYSIPFTMIID